MSSSDDDDRKGGVGKDGRRFKDGNTREDGSYEIGKGRTPEHGKFRKGDGRSRGKREKGSKNLSTIWDKQLRQKLTINGKTKTAAEWLVDGLIRRGITRSDRAAQTALEQAERLDRTRERTVIGREDEVIAAYMAEQIATLGIGMSEDTPEPDAMPASDDNGETSDAGK